MRGQFFSNAVARLGISNPSLRALSSRYSLLRPMGVSRGVESYLMRDRQSGDVVCARVLSRSASADLTQVELFHIQAGAASVLNHPGVVGCTVARQEGGAHFAIVEHKQGCDNLRALLDREGWLDYRRAASIAYDITDCLDYAHRRGVIHLGLEPGSVQIATSGKAFLGGFGMPIDPILAWAARARSICCFPQYASPEQLTGEQPDSRSDLYSLGALLFEMLTDRLPFNSVDADIIKVRQSQGAPRPPHAYCDDVPEALSELTLGLLAADPDTRRQDTGSLKMALAGMAGLQPEGLAD